MKRIVILTTLALNTLVCIYSACYMVNEYNPERWWQFGNCFMFVIYVIASFAGWIVTGFLISEKKL